MARPTECLRFRRNPDGSVSVSAPGDLQPLEDFLESDIGDNVRELDLVIGHARDPGPTPWGFGGDSCHVSIGPEDVRVENDFTGQDVTLPRTDFLRILEDYAAAVTG
jgi:hypothetical protein